MRKILKAIDFKEYFNKTDSLVAATIAQDCVEEFLKKLITDPTKGATGQYAEGYRACIKDLMGELE